MRLSSADPPPNWWLAVAALIYLIALFPSPEYPLYNADDGAWFLTLAINLAEHGRYSADTMMLAEYGRHATWPPGFPSLMAAIVAIAGVNWVAIKLTTTVFSLFTLYLLTRYWRNDPLGQWATLALATSPLWFLYSHHPMSEVVYLAAVVTTLIALQRADSKRAALLASLLASLAFYIRGYAVTLLPAAILYFSFQRTWPARRRIAMIIVFSLPMLLSITAWWTYTSWIIAHYPLDWITAQFGNGTGMLQSLLRPPAEYAKRLWWHDLRYPLHLMFPLVGLNQVLTSDLLALVSAGVLACCLQGWILALRAKKDILSLWLPLGLAFLFVPQGTAARYWLTFLPFLMYYFLLAMRRLSTRLPQLYPVALFLLLGVNLIALGLHLAEPDRLRFREPSLRSFRDLAQSARGLLPKDAIVITKTPNRFYAVAQRETLLPEHYIAMDPTALSGRPIYVVCAIDIPDRSALATLCAKAAANGRALLQQGKMELYQLEFQDDTKRE